MLSTANSTCASSGVVTIQDTANSTSASPGVVTVLGTTGSTGAFPEVVQRDGNTKRHKLKSNDACSSRSGFRIEAIDKDQKKPAYF